MDSHRIFTAQQMAEIYRCVYNTLDSGYYMTPARKRALEEITEQIEHGVPDLDEMENQSNENEMNMGL